jgi:hypothetical protein
VLETGGAQAADGILVTVSPGAGRLAVAKRFVADIDDDVIFLSDQRVLMLIQ